MPQKEVNEVLDFIHRRFSKDSDWTNGNCFWFAAILKARFSFLSVYYLPVSGHFIAGALNTYFDWTGRIKPEEPIYLFEEVIQNDPIWASHIIRDCVL